MSEQDPFSPNCEDVPIKWPKPGDALRRNRGVTFVRSKSFAQENKYIGVLTSGGDSQGRVVCIVAHLADFQTFICYLSFLYTCMNGCI